MTEPLQVGQFAIVDHEPVDRGPNAGVFHGKGPADDRAELFILAEGTTPAGEAFAGHVVSALGNAMNVLDMSLTGSLQKLFDEAERNLRDWNRKSIAQHRVSIGLTCFGRRGTQAVIAQAGPSAVFHLHGGTIQTYFTDEEHGRPIGAGPVEPQLTRIEFAPGDRLLLVSTIALRELDDEVLGGILALPGDQILPDLYRRVQHMRHLTAVLVTDSAPTRMSAPLPPEDDDYVIDATSLSAPANANRDTPATLDNTFQPSLFIDDEKEDAVFSAKRQLLQITPRRPIEPMSPVAVAEMPAPFLRAAGDTALARIAAERRARAAVSQAAVASAMASNAMAANGPRPAWRTGHATTIETAMPSNPPATTSASSDARRRRERRDSFSRGLVVTEAPPRKPDMGGKSELPFVDAMAAEHRARSTVLAPATETIAGDASATLSSGGSLVRVRGDMGGRWKGSGAFGGRNAVNASLPPTWLVIVVGLGILLTLVGLVTVPRLLDEETGERYAMLLDGAQQKLSLAQVQQDAGQKRAVLSEAHSMLLQARELQGDNARTEALFSEVAGALTVMNNVKAPAAVDVLVSLEQFGDKPVSVSRLTVGDENAYILDSGSNQVLALTFATTDKKVVFAEDKEQKRGKPVATAYLEASDLGGPVLLIVDNAKALWAYSPAGGLRQVAFAPPGNLQITDIAISGRDLFVLDAAQAAVFRFVQGDGSFATTPRKELDTPDLAAARRLMVDGEIITSDANGTVHRFISGAVALTLSQSGIDKKLVAPETAQALTRNGELAILDPTNDRVVVLRRDGGFDRQYTHKDFRGSTAFAIHKGTAYVFSDSKLRRVTW